MVILTCTVSYLCQRLVTGDWNGAGGHVNFSSNSTRKENTGWDVIQEHMKKLEKKHALHIASYPL